MILFGLLMAAIVVLGGICLIYLIVKSPQQPMYSMTPRGEHNPY